MRPDSQVVYWTKTNYAVLIRWGVMRCFNVTHNTNLTNLYEEWLEKGAVEYNGDLSSEKKNNCHKIGQ